jgi:hypothetical protein
VLRGRSVLARSLIVYCGVEEVGGSAPALADHTKPSRGHFKPRLLVLCSLRLRSYGCAIARLCAELESALKKTTAPAFVAKTAAQ